MSLIADWKVRLADVPGIETLTMQEFVGRKVFGLDGVIVAVDPHADDQTIEAELRKAARLPAVRLNQAPPQPKESPAMTKPAPGSFAASLRAMMDEARAGIEQARADGVNKVKEAVGKLREAKQATVKVSGNIAKTIEDEAASVMAELGQISNDLGE